MVTRGIVWLAVRKVAYLGGREIAGLAGRKYVHLGPAVEVRTSWALDGSRGCSRLGVSVLMVEEEQIRVHLNVGESKSGMK